MSGKPSFPGVTLGHLEAFAPIYIGAVVLAAAFLVWMVFA